MIQCSLCQHFRWKSQFLAIYNINKQDFRGSNTICCYEEWHCPRLGQTCRNPFIFSISSFSLFTRNLSSWVDEKYAKIILDWIQTSANAVNQLREVLIYQLLFSSICSVITSCMYLRIYHCNFKTCKSLIHPEKTHAVPISLFMF